MLKFSYIYIRVCKYADFDPSPFFPTSRIWPPDSTVEAQNVDGHLLVIASYCRIHLGEHSVAMGTWLHRNAFTRCWISSGTDHLVACYSHYTLMDTLLRWTRGYTVKPIHVDGHLILDLLP